MEGGLDCELSLLDCPRLWDLSDDGRRIVFWECGEGVGKGRNWVCLRNTNGDPPSRQEAFGRQARSSPRTALFADELMQVPSVLYNVDPATGARVEFGRIGPADTSGVLGIELYVTPDGQKIAFVVMEDFRVLCLADGLP